MLSSLLRHGFPTSVKARVVRNGSSTVVLGEFSTSSRPKGERTDSWTTVANSHQNEGPSPGNHKKPLEIRPGTINHHAAAVLSSSSDEGTARREENGTRSGLGFDTISIDIQDGASPGIQERQNENGINKTAENPSSNTAAPLEADAPLSSYIGQVLERRLAVDKKASRNDCRDSSFFDRSHEEGLKGGDAVRDRPSQALEHGLRADASFLDGLDNGFSVRRPSPKIDESVSAAPKLERLRQLVMAGDTRRLLVYLWRESEDLNFMRAIPGLTFVELLRRLQPGDEFSPLRSDYKELGPKHYIMLMRFRQNMYSSLQERRQLYHDIVVRRIDSGATLAVGEYMQLLNLARSTWDGPAASDIMKGMIANGIRPNLNCYNYYFEARCWSDAYHPGESQLLRIIPRNIGMRKEQFRRPVTGGLMLYGHKVDQNGIRLELTQLFTKMVNEGINPNTRSYCNLILAYSREGDLLSIKSVLKQVWNVDVDALLAGKPDYGQQSLNKDNPTYPTDDLLYSLAHAFGSNNEIPAAMQIVAHFSSKYDIDISQAVWCELLEWTFVLSTPRRKLRLTDGTSTGLLPLGSVESLFNVMLSPPYHGKPTVRMYDFLLRSLWRRPYKPNSVQDYIARMRDGVKIHEQAFDAFEVAWSDLRSMQARRGAKDFARLDAQRARISQAWKERWFSFVLARKWFDLLLSCPRWLRDVSDRDTIWTRKLLPDCIKEFWRYRPLEPFNYLITTGRVELEEQNRGESWSFSKPKREMQRWESHRLSLDGADDQMELLEAEMEYSDTDDNADDDPDPDSDPQWQEEDEIWDDDNPRHDSKVQADP